MLTKQDYNNAEEAIIIIDNMDIRDEPALIFNAHKILYEFAKKVILTHKGQSYMGGC